METHYFTFLCFVFRHWRLKLGGVPMSISLVNDQSVILEPSPTQKQLRRLVINEIRREQWTQRKSKPWLQHKCVCVTSDWEFWGRWGWACSLHCFLSDSRGLKEWWDRAGQPHSKTHTICRAFVYLILYLENYNYHHRQVRIVPCICIVVKM